jgi:hypothetical protein
MASFASFANAAGVCASRGGGNILSNTGMGYQALTSNTSGYQNTAFGFQALRNNTTGRQNTAVGYKALRNETTGVCNTAIGAFAAYNQNGASNTTAVGFSAGCSITTGGSNTLVGAYAGCAITTGNSNTAIGFRALRSLTTTNWNTAIGAYALCAATGGCNTAIGFRAGQAITSGIRNTIIGAAAGGSVSTATQTVIASRGGSTSNTGGHTLWGSSGMWFNWIQNGWSNLSDCRDKTCIQDLDQRLGLALIRRVVPVSFKWDNRQNYVDKCGFEYGVKDGTLAAPKKTYGFEAQQLKQSLEELEVEFEALGYDEEKDAYRITYDEFIAPLIKAVQETADRLETLEALAQ